MGSGKMGHWFVGKIPRDMEGINLKKIPYETNIPLFHHSIIPCTMQKHQASKPTITLNNLFNYLNF
jgi:hypothetical protein